MRLARVRNAVAGGHRWAMQPTDHHHPEPDGERIPVRGPAALAAALPYLFDVPLEGRIVIAGVHDDNSLGLTAYSDLPAYPQGASAEVLRHWASDIGTIAAEGARGFGASTDERLAMAVYLPAAAGVPPAWFGSAVMSQGLSWAPRLLDAIVVFGDRWRSLVCTSEECCPTTGQPILDNSDAALIAAQLVAAGLSAAGVERPSPVSARVAEVAALLAAMPYPANVKSRRKLLRKAWPLVSAPPAVVDEQSIAMLTMAADRPGVRDALLTRLAGLDGGTTFWDEQFGLWLVVSAGVPQEWAAGPACMVAIAAWRLEEHAAAAVAVGHALHSEPEHRMANLIKQLLDKGTPSQEWFDRMRGISESDCLRFDRPAHRRSAQAKATG